MRTFHAIGLALISFTITLAIFQPSAPALAQQQASSPTQPRELALRATEGAGATIFGNVCGSCHGIQGTNDAMSQDMLKQLTPEKLYESMTTGTMRTHADAATPDRRSTSGNRGVGERKTVGLHREWGSRDHAKQVPHISSGDQSIRAVLERMEPGHDEEQSLPDGEGGRRSRAQRVGSD